MLKSLLDRPMPAVYPWTPFLGLVRTLLATGTLLTLVATPTPNLFRPIVGVGMTPTCEGVSAISIFCVAPSGYLWVSQVVACVILAVTISGFFIRATALLHWWVSFSVFTGVAISDGGDQVTAIATLILLPLCFFDPRKSHWHRGVRERPPWVLAIGICTLVVLKAQAVALYFQAGVAKIGQEEWVEGSSAFYSLQGWFGMSAPLSHLIAPLLASAVVTAAASWGTIALETALAVSPLTGGMVRRVLLVGGLGLHGSIALTMGLWSFSMAMFAVVLLLTVPLASPIYQPGATLRELREWFVQPWSSEVIVMAIDEEVERPLRLPV